MLQQATADSATLDEKAGGKALLDRAKAFGFNGTAVKVRGSCTRFESTMKPRSWMIGD